MQPRRHSRQLLSAAIRSPWAGYVIAIGVPIATMLIGSRFGMPAFLFEHVIILFVVAVAMVWGVAPAVAAALAAALGDNILLRDPAGRPTITGTRDVLDLVLFSVVAVVVGWLVATARREREAAQTAAHRERQFREDRDRLVAMVSHDLVTPLTVIRGTIQRARRGPSTDTIDLDRLWLRLDTAAARAASLVRTLTDVRLLDTGHLSLEMQTLDVRELLEPVVRMMDRISEPHLVTFTVNDGPLHVLCDGDRLQRVFENLLSNAIKYSPQGGSVDVTLSREGDHVVVTVCDTGIGIPQDALPHLFERGYRTAEASATAPGLGLGLSISAEIVERHHGTIEARHGHPRGAVFIVRLPHVAEPTLRVQRAGLDHGLQFHEPRSRSGGDVLAPKCH